MLKHYVLKNVFKLNFIICNKFISYVHCSLITKNHKHFFFIINFDLDGLYSFIIFYCAFLLPFGKKGYLYCIEQIYCMKIDLKQLSEARTLKISYINVHKNNLI